MPSRRKPVIARAFGQARDYEAHAHIQRATARRLGEHIAALSIPPGLPVLEIGCGTGFLSRELAQLEAGRQLILSDLSPAMIARTRAGIGDAPYIRYLALDGERPPFAAGPLFGLICSSLAFQWFEDLGGAIAGLVGLLAPGGRLAFTTLAAGTFAEWHEAHRRCALGAATRDYPSIEELRTLCPQGCAMEIGIDRLVERHADGLAFLRGLKAIGANTPWADRAPLPASMMRKVLRAFDDGGASVTYRIAHVLIKRAPEDL